MPTVWIALCFVLPVQRHSQQHPSADIPQRLSFRGPSLYDSRGTHIEFLCPNMQLLTVTQNHRSEAMPDDGTTHNNDASHRNTSPWPFPVGSWIVPGFWLLVVVAALILRWLR